MGLEVHVLHWVPEADITKSSYVFKKQKTDSSFSLILSSFVIRGCRVCTNIILISLINWWKEKKENGGKKLDQEYKKRVDKEYQKVNGQDGMDMRRVAADTVLMTTIVLKS